jgi:hypothetical protein
MVLTKAALLLESESTVKNRFGKRLPPRTRGGKFLSAAERKLMGCKLAVAHNRRLQQFGA